MVYYSTLKTVATLALLTLTAANDDAEEARWMVQSSLWGTLSWMEGAPSSMVTSIAESDGRIFYYLPIDIEDGFEGSLTLSEAALDSSQFEGAKCGPDGALDPEDPRCAKLTLSGTVKPAHDDDLTLGKTALFAAHPQMATWPPDHGFVVYEHHLTQLWMIANFGGGGFMDPADYSAADPVRHSVQGYPHRRLNAEETTTTEAGSGRPDFGDDAAGHARWLVAKSLWTTVTTVSSRHAGRAFGNIRSVADGACFLGSSGKPYFYLPTPDPTMVDIAENDGIVLSFTEAALPEMVDDAGVCGGKDAEDPTCAKISIVGRAVPLTDEQVDLAEASFGAQHPRASWLAQGGGHTGGGYYTIDIDSMEFFRNYGGLAKVSVEDYEAWEPDAAKFSGETTCDDAAASAASTSTTEHGSWGHGSGNHDGSGGHDWEGHEHGEGHGWEGHEHEHGEGHDWEGHERGEGHDHGGEGDMEHGGHDGYEHHHHEESDKDEDKAEFSTMSFLAGTAFGFLFWGPTVALVVYHKSCGCGGSGSRGGQKYEAAPKGDFV